MPLSGTSVGLSVLTTLIGGLDIQTQKSELQFTRGFSLDSGTGANQADKVWSDTRTITASGTDDIDLAGVLLDAFGAALTFAKVKLIAVAAYAANTNNCVVGAAAATQFVGPFGAATHTVAVAPGGFFCITRPDAAGWAVGAGASDLLRVTNSAGGTSVTYDVVILGTSA